MSTQIVSGIYRIRNTLNGRVYVGASANLTDRWRLHRLHLNRGGHHCRALQNAWVKYGEPAFVFEIMEAIELKEARDSREQVYLDDAFATGLAYNIARKASSHLGVTCSAKSLHEGERFGRLVVISFDGSRKGITRAGSAYYKLYYLCRCDCGEHARVERGNLKNGNTMSCGCLRREVISGVNRTHGMSRTPTYSCWLKMIDRCYRTTDRSYTNYGARGIGVCERWRDSFDAFLEDMGEKPSAGRSIDRINNDGDYEPGNCRWATRREQARNTTRSRWITFNGKRALLTEWVRTTGIRFSTLRYRLSRWPISRALTQARDLRKVRKRAKIAMRET